MELIDGVLEVEPAQQRIRCHFSGAQDVASAIGLDFGEREQLPHAPVEVAPHPPVHGPHHAIDTRAPVKSHQKNYLSILIEEITA